MTDLDVDGAAGGTGWTASAHSPRDARARAQVEPRAHRAGAASTAARRECAKHLEIAHADFRHEPVAAVDRGARGGLRDQDVTVIAQLVDRASSVKSASRLR